MESDMVNGGALNPLDCILIVEKYFEEYFKEYVLLNKTNYTGYWRIEYSDGLDIKICFDGDIGGHFSVKIFIGDTENHLWQFDRSVNNATKSIRKNIIYQLDILNRFLKENNYH